MFKYITAGALALGLLFWFTFKYEAEAVTISLPPVSENSSTDENDLSEEENEEMETNTTVVIDHNEKLCLAKAIYYEARNQSIDGKIAVATVVLNRVKTGIYPNTICQVVHSGCQFSWNCDKRNKPNPAEHKNVMERYAWNDALLLANDMILEYNSERFEDITKGATFFHASYVDPQWRKWKKLQKTVKIDKHIFYKMKE